MRVNTREVARREFIEMIGRLVNGKHYDHAERLILTEATMHGPRNSRWKQAVADFESNRAAYPDSQRWALLQWTIAANYANKP